MKIYEHPILSINIHQHLLTSIDVVLVTSIKETMPLTILLQDHDKHPQADIVLLRNITTV